MKPMLAATVDDTRLLRFPLLASPKLDGIRALVKDGVLVSRNFKPIPNDYVQAQFGRPELNGLDGELICGDPTHPEAFRRTTSAVMSKDGEPRVNFWVFDHYTQPMTPFEIRLDRAETLLKPRLKLEKLIDFERGFKLVEHIEVRDHLDIEKLELEWLGLGYEGLMLRDPMGFYKFGRSTLREHGLMKLKRFEDAEAIILDFEEQMQNTNEATRDNLGRTKRSNHKEGMKGKGTLGALRVKGVNGRYKGVEFSVGSGFDDVERQHIWTLRGSYRGKTIRVKYFPLGSKDAPRFPTFLGFRKD